MDFWNLRPVKPGDTVPMQTWQFAGPRPLSITTSLWGVGLLFVPLSQRTSRFDGARWSVASSVSLPGENGEAVVHYRVEGDSFRAAPQ